MTSLNNPVNLPLDTNGYVKSSIWGQNMNPNVNTVASVTGAVGSVTGAVTSWATISHQTGLSGTPSAANAPVNVGTSITAPRAGILKIKVYGHVSSSDGYIDIALTSGGITSYIPNTTSTSIANTLFSNVIGETYMGGILNNTSEAYLYPTVQATADYGNLLFIMELVVNASDVIQFRVSNSLASDTTYIDDLEVVLQ